MLMSLIKSFSAIVLIFLSLQLSANARSAVTREQAMAASAEKKADMAAKERMNASTVGFAAGLLEGAPLRERELAQANRVDRRARERRGRNRLQ